MADNGAYADLLQDSLSPLTAAGIDPDEARLDRAGTMQRLFGDPEPASWMDAYKGADGAEPGPEGGPAPEAAPEPQQGSQRPLPQLKLRHPRENPDPAPNDPALPALQTGFDPASTPAAPAAPSTTSPNPGGTDYSPYAKAGLEGTLSLARRADETAKQMEAQPSEQQVLEPLQDKLAAATTPLNPKQRAYDPNQPKSPTNMPGQQSYRPSFAQRLMRGVEGFAGGGVLGTIDPVIGGAKPYGAPNTDYDHDEAVRQAKVTSTTERLKQTAQAYKDAQERLKAQGQMQNETAGTYDKLPAAVAGQENAATAAKNAQTTRDRLQMETPEAKAAAVEAQQQRRIAQLHDPTSMLSKIPVSQQLQYITSGTVSEREPRQASPEEINQQRVLTAWQNDPANKGKKPTVEQWGDIIATAYGRQAPGDKADAKDELEDSKAQAVVADSTGKKEVFASQYDRDPATGSYVKRNSPTGESLTPAEFQQRIEQFRLDGNKQLDAIGYKMDDHGNVVRTRPPRSAAPAAVPAQVAPILPDPRKYQKGTVLYGKKGEKITNLGDRWQ